MPTRRAALACLIAAGPLLLAPSLSLAADQDSGIPNLFISPCGEPFRADVGAPYPVAAWFGQADANRDGKLARDEFVADADRFFKKLDLNGDGALTRGEILSYEHKWVPEILVGSVTTVGALPARLWLAQYGGGSQSALSGLNAPINPRGDHVPAPVQRKGLDESGAGASPYSFFDEPEPILAADFNINGVISRDNFLKLADMHFTALDPDERGYLTLESLPQTTVEKLLGRSRRVRR
jgi:hypothetical protein